MRVVWAPLVLFMVGSLRLTWSLSTGPGGYGARRFLSSRPQRRIVQMVSTDQEREEKGGSLSAVEKLGNAGIAGAAVIAAGAINQEVSKKRLSAPETKKSFVVTDGGSTDRIGQVDEVGLPLVYNKDAIEKYWASQSGALTQRWSEFLGVSVPFLTRVLTIVNSKGSGALDDEGADLTRDARVRMEKLGATYIKLF